MKAQVSDRSTDIFHRTGKVDFSNPPPVDIMPVLPAMLGMMDVDLAVNDKGYSPHRNI